MALNGNPWKSWTLPHRARGEECGTGLAPGLCSPHPPFESRAMGSLLFPVTIPEHRMLLDAYARGGAGEAARVFRELFPELAHDGFVEACTRQVVGGAWDDGEEPLPPAVMRRLVRQ